MFGLDTNLTIILILCMVAACAFEFINGFHDTANAVATVIYTRSLKPQQAVIWSGIWNFIGVYFGGIAVAMAIVNLLPMEALVDQNVYHNVAMIMALILTAIIWNLGTWYFGIPASSSHTLIGSIFGVGIAFMFINPDGAVALNWHKVADAFLALLISPIIGFFGAWILMIVFKKYVKKKKFFKAADPDKKPPFIIRGVLVLTSTMLSFSHGSNDGQKGVGLMMIILISLLPAKFALDQNKNASNMLGNIRTIEAYISKIDTIHIDTKTATEITTIKTDLLEIKNTILTSDISSEIDESKRFKIRSDIIIITRSLDKIISDPNKKQYLNLTSSNISHLKSNLAELKSFTEFAPGWVILLISISLGLGTMIGWKRIVTTIGEKIGKTPMTFAQGTSSGLIATTTILLASVLGLPVSTTHVLSSGVAGTMASEGGVKNLQTQTLKNIGIAWVVTIPVTVIISCSLFLLFRWMIV
ncbi:MAG: inorganic phosphate transporter [Bacteroidota bacterium]